MRKADPGEAYGDITVDTGARSGIVCARDDLARAGRDRGLGVRIGERRFILRSLVQQDPAATFAWLATVAAAWSARHATMHEQLGCIAVHWEERAGVAEALFLELSRAAEEVMVGAADR